MSQYLDLAERILRLSKTPLSARQILGTALKLGIVPDDLYGQTQHKTLQARLSEDILHHKKLSKFYRTKRGIFFLREFLDDPTFDAPAEIIARRRKLGLRFRNILSRRYRGLSTTESHWLPSYSLFNSSKLFYQDHSKSPPGTIRFWAAAALYRDEKYLVYRRGSYREDRDPFLGQRCIIFFAPLVQDDRDLFNHLNEGIKKAVLEIVSMDLDMPLQLKWQNETTMKSVGCLVSQGKNSVSEAVEVTKLSVPRWFEPPRQKLSINDLQWLNLNQINNRSDFDPWSQRVIERLVKTSSSLEERSNDESIAIADS